MSIKIIFLEEDRYIYMNNLQKYSLYLDFIDAFQSITYKGFPLVLFINFQLFINILNNQHIQSKITDTEFEQCLKNKVLVRREIQPKFDQFINPLKRPLSNEKKNGKILLYDEVNLRFTDNVYLEYFDSSTTVILRTTSQNKQFLGIPIHCLNEYKSDIGQLMQEIKRKTDKIFLSNKSHPIFKIARIQKRLHMEMRSIMQWLPAVINYFEQTPISCILLGGGGDHVSRTLIFVASSKGIPSICLQHGIIAADRGWLPTYATKEAVYGEYEKEFYKSAGVPEEKIEIIGHPKYDRIFTETYMTKDEFCKKLGINPHKKTILIATQPVAWGVSILQPFIESLIHYDFEIIIKPHPSEIRTGLFKEYEKLTKQHQSVKLAVAEPELYQILANVDIVCVFYSTVGLEAALFGKPVIYSNTGPYEGADYEYAKHLTESIPNKLAYRAKLLTTNQAYRKKIDDKKRNLLLKAYPQQLSGKKLSDLIYRLTGIRSYKLMDDISEGMLIKGSNEKIYIIEDGMKRHIANPSAFKQSEQKWGNVHVIDDDVLRKIPSGTIIYSSDQ